MNLDGERFRLSSLVMFFGFELGRRTGMLFIYVFEDVESIQPGAPARFQPPCPYEGPRPDSLD